MTALVVLIIVVVGVWFAPTIAHFLLEGRHHDAP